MKSIVFLLCVVSAIVVSSCNKDVVCTKTNISADTTTVESIITYKKLSRSERSKIENTGTYTVMNPLTGQRTSEVMTVCQ